MKTRYQDICDEEITDTGIALLHSGEMQGGAEGRLSLYGVRLDGSWFYAVAVASEDSGERTAEMLGRDRETAECIYRRLLRYGVTPDFLREIVFDQLGAETGNPV